ncbi:Calcium-transporting ATPase [Venustampulla echinocandica]|uniref:Calcium-transporting ATPase n=1 Tax=Venustampulla echinocandica TaxID=2656787 RepID=A0A370TK31_9HELO|nr:Calcium-transporting ATPase [Venustampulla echinocandica]RDL35879.1 Calcium-transporting ATPase [Venustampulla echinocandica]
MPVSLAQIDEKVEENNTAWNGNAQRITPGRALGSEPDELDREPCPTLNDKFAFSHTQLDELVNEKSLTAYRASGGLAGLERGLRTDRRSGLSVDETILDGGAVSTPAGRVGRPLDESFADRKCAFGDNTIPRKRSLSILRLMWMAYNDPVLFLLTAAAIVSLAIGLYQTFGTVASATNPRVEWVEGVAIIIAIIIIVLVGAANDWERQRQFAKLDKKKQDRDVKVIRSGKSQMISTFNVLVGDVVHLEPGDVIPADGIFIDGYNVKCDESSATGESRLIRKHPGEEVFRNTGKQGQEDVLEMDPFIISGAKVAEGVGTFLVTATGVNSSYGRILMSLHDGPSFTPLQEKLNNVAKFISKSGAVAALVLFAVLFIKFLVQLPHRTDTTPAEKGQNFLNILIISLTVLVIAVPEGLPLAVTLALAFASNKMLKDYNLVRQLKACETMGNATSICSDKTGTLTQNKMTVVSGTFGTNLQFDESSKASLSESGPDSSSSQEKSVHPATVALPTRRSVGSLADNVKEVLKQSIILNTTAFEGEVDGRQTFIGSQTETALLAFARTYLGVEALTVERSNTKTIEVIPFDATNKSMGVVVALESGYRLYVKGASEIILRKCTRVIRDPSHDFSSIGMSATSTEYLSQIITDYASRSLRTIGLAYRDFDQWPPSSVKQLQIAEGGATEANAIFEDLVLFGIVGIQDPLREGARDAVRDCQKAGVIVRMVTGDNIFTAKAIAEQCGIIDTSAGDTAMEGAEFRRLRTTEMDEVIPRLRVLARSSPQDKRTLVTRLKELGEVVAVTGDGTNDALALKAADVSFSMGISGTEVAREASSIVLMDDNFASIVKSIMWGRAVNDAVKQFLQFQITVTITSVILTAVSAIANSEEQSVLTAVQLMWINLFQDTMAALALATDAPTQSVLDRKPDPKTAPLINTAMWKMIFGQSAYQLAITLILYFGGAKILSYQTPHETAQLQTIIFNTYVWMQIFNMYNNRRLNNKFNIFAGLGRNWFFIAISLIMIGTQILIVFIGGRAFSITRLNGAQWGVSVTGCSLEGSGGLGTSGLHLRAAVGGE